MSTSRAVFFEVEPGRVILRSVPKPVPRGEQILVRVLGCTICGSDLHTFKGRRKVPVPMVLGHEIVGEIEAWGDAAPHRDLSGRPLQIGDRVTWAIVANCGTCLPCRRGLPQKCRHAVKYGHEQATAGRELTGGLADHCLLAPGTALVHIPEGMPLETACPASCATATVAAALEAAGDLDDRSVAVFGAGLLGLTACAMARTRGAAVVLCVDPQPGRQSRALRFGATHIAAPDAVPAVTDTAVGPDGFDAALELSGNGEAVRAVWPHLGIGAVLVLVGSVFPSEPVPFALEEIVRRHLTIRGIHNYAPRHLLDAVRFLAAEGTRYPFAELVTPWLPLEDAAEAFALGLQPGTIRAGVRPGRLPTSTLPTSTL